MRICKYPGCYRLTDAQYCLIHVRLGAQAEVMRQLGKDDLTEKYNKDAFAKLSANKLRTLHQTYRWRKIRAEMLESIGYCERCGSTDRLEVHHIKKASNEIDFYDKANLSVLCHECHKIESAKQMRGEA